jgi:hypothetical protein
LTFLLMLCHGILPLSAIALAAHFTMTVAVIFGCNAQ